MVTEREETGFLSFCFVPVVSRLRPFAITTLIDRGKNQVVDLLRLVQLKLDVNLVLNAVTQCTLYRRTSITPATNNLSVLYTLAALSSNDQSEINLRPTSIPNLARFTGPHNTARVLVPQRPVEALFLSEVISDDSIFGQLSLGLLLRVTAISRSMPSLHHLQLMTVAPLDDHFDPVSRHRIQTCLRTSSSRFAQTLYQQLSDVLGPCRVLISSSIPTRSASSNELDMLNDSNSNSNSDPPSRRRTIWTFIFEFSENMILF